MRKKLCFEIGQLGNMDEAPLTFHRIKHWMLRGVKRIMIKTSGNEKTRYTAVLARCVDGTKLPPLLAFKRKTLHKNVIPHGIYVPIHSKRWMDGEGMKLCLEKVCSKRSGGLLKKPSLLVCDQFKAHITE